MNTDRMTDEAMDARVALYYIAFEAQDNDDDATRDLAMLLASPTPAEWRKYESDEK